MVEEKVYCRYDERILGCGDRDIWIDQNDHTQTEPEQVHREGNGGQKRQRGEPGDASKTCLRSTLPLIRMQEFSNNYFKSQRPK